MVRTTQKTIAKITRLFFHKIYGFPLQEFKQMSNDGLLKLSDGLTGCTFLWTVVFVSM